MKPDHDDARELADYAAEGGRTFPAKHVANALAAYIERDDENAALRAFAEKVDAIRNSIVGYQNVNWSAHIYPLVEALGEAGYEGEGYDVAHAKARTQIQRIEELERALLAKEGTLTDEPS